MQLVQLCVLYLFEHHINLLRSSVICSMLNDKYKHVHAYTIPRTHISRTGVHVAFDCAAPINMRNWLYNRLRLRIGSRKYKPCILPPLTVCSGTHSPPLSLCTTSSPLPTGSASIPNTLYIPIHQVDIC